MISFPSSTREVLGADHVKLFVEECGAQDKPSILFIHGAFQASLCWNAQFQSDLPKQYRLVRFDLRGHGRSEKPDDRNAYLKSEIFAEDVHSIITALHLEHPALVAWSFGGFLVGDYFRKYGQHALGGIMFIDSMTSLQEMIPCANPSTDLAAMMAGLISRDVTENTHAVKTFIQDMFAKPLAPVDYYMFLGFNTDVPLHVRQAAFERETYATSSLLESLTIPVWILQGLQDSYLLPKAADWLQEHIPHAVRSNYPECGHFPALEASERFEQDLRAFMGACQH